MLTMYEKEMIAPRKPTVHTDDVEEDFNYVLMTWKIPSQALMLDRKEFPRPFPSWAPFTSPAISTTFRKAGTLLQNTIRSTWKA